MTFYTYAADDQRLSMAGTNAQVPTPAVSFAYDAAYGRLALMTDGTGVTTYAYHAPGLQGAGQVAAVDGPLASDTITYTYDALGRVSSESNLLRTFTYGYDGLTSRLASVIYPNGPAFAKATAGLAGAPASGRASGGGQTTPYSYFGVEYDRRLQTIHHKYPNGQTLSKFDYIYDTVGNIVSWRQQADQEAVRWEYGYDAADQLVAAVKKAVDPQETVLTRYAYA